MSVFQSGNWATLLAHGLNYRYDSPDSGRPTWPEMLQGSTHLPCWVIDTAATIKYYRSGVLYKSGARKGSAVPAHDSRAEVRGFLTAYMVSLAALIVQ